MRLRPFLQAGESPRPFSETKLRRGDDEPAIDRALRDLEELEEEAAAAETPEEAKRLQCEAEELRCAIYHQPRRR